MFMCRLEDRMQTMGTYLFWLGIGGVIACAVGMVVSWVRVAKVFFPFWLDSLKLTREQRSQLSSYMLAPVSSFNDAWVAKEVRELLPQLPKIMKRMFHFFAYGIAAFGFGLIAEIAKPFK
jgi:hypothetical protein